MNAILAILEMLKDPKVGGIYNSGENMYQWEKDIRFSEKSNAEKISACKLQMIEIKKEMIRGLRQIDIVQKELDSLDKKMKESENSPTDDELIRSCELAIFISEEQSSIDEYKAEFDKARMLYIEFEKNEYDYVSDLINTITDRKKFRDALEQLFIKAYGSSLKATKYRLFEFFDGLCFDKHGVHFYASFEAYKSERKKKN